MSQFEDHKSRDAEALAAAQLYNQLSLSQHNMICQTPERLSVTAINAESTMMLTE